MDNIFHFEDYRLLTKHLLNQKPNGGWGQQSSLAKNIAVTTTFVSQVLRGEKDFSPEQAAATCQFLELNEVERDYYLALVDLSRAGTPLLKSHIIERIKRMRLEAKKLNNKIKTIQEVPEEATNKFYSQWYYSGIRLLTSIPKYNNAESISQYFGIPKDQVLQILDFLVLHKLVIKENGHYSLGISRTYLPPNSPLVGYNHLSWRIKSLSRVHNLSTDEMMLTAPMSISIKDYNRILLFLRETIFQILQSTENTEAEMLATLNIDLLKF